MPSRKLSVLILATSIAPFLFSAILLAQPAGGDAPPPPFTVVFDTGTVSTAALGAEMVAAKKGWTAVPEDNLTHAFAGDAVFMNDRVAVVVRRGAEGPELYSRGHGSFALRATLHPINSGGAGGKVSAVKILENSQAAVMLEVTTSANGAAATFRFRLSAGDPLLEVRGGQQAGALGVVDHARYVVVPDFFADDIVIDPLKRQGTVVGLPAENSVLGLTDEGNAIVACVWPSPRQEASLNLAGEGQQRSIASYQVGLTEGDRLWLAVLEGKGIWHVRPSTASGSRPSPASGSTAVEVALDWHPPMPARWRADFVGANGDAISSGFADPQAGMDSESLRNDGRCRLDAGRALVRTADSGDVLSSGLIVVYPIERTRNTPLTEFCLVDIMRNALGVGPCQYVLDTERLGAADDPTPRQVTQWAQKEFEKKPTKRDPDAIRDQLGKMVQQVKRTDARIGDYVSFGVKVKKSATESAAKWPDPAVAKSLLTVADSMTGPAAAGPEVEKLAANVAAQAGQADALAKTQSSIAGIREAGAGQDYALARMRMAVRRLKQEARTLAATNPATAAFAGEIQQQADQMLVKK